MIVGDWTGSELYFKTDSIKGNGFFLNDFHITADSLFQINYPTNSLSTPEHYELTNDSIIFPNGRYKWSVTDSTLTFVGYTFNQYSKIDSLILNRTKFDLDIVSDLKMSSYNMNLLTSTNWKIDTQNTKSIVWENSKYPAYNSENYFKWSKKDYHALNGKILIFENDTFEIIDFYSLDYLGKEDDYRLLLNKDINGETVKINYISK